MPKKRAPREGETTFDTYTVACPGRKRQWRREVLPELVLWLTLQAERVANALAHAERAAKEHGHDASFQQVTALHTRLTLLTELLRDLPGKWSETVWFANVPHAAEVLAMWAKPAPPAPLDGFDTP